MFADCRRSDRIERESFSVSHTLPVGTTDPSSASRAWRFLLHAYPPRISDLSDIQKNWPCLMYFPGDQRTASFPSLSHSTLRCNSIPSYRYLRRDSDDGHANNVYRDSPRRRLNTFVFSFVPYFPSVSYRSSQYSPFFSCFSSPLFLFSFSFLACAISATSKRLPALFLSMIPRPFHIFHHVRRSKTDLPQRGSLPPLKLYRAPRSL